MRMRKKKNLIPRMERCAARLIRDPYDRPGRWRELMPQCRELRLELGCGKGRFTAGTAAAEPDVLFLAIEVVPDAMVVAMERCVGAGLENVWFISANADQLPYFFAPGEVDRIYINFCDPWPSGRHAKRRLTHGNFLKLYRQVLKMGGEIHFKTDNRPLFEFSLGSLFDFGFHLSEISWNLHENGPVGIMTDYEAKFHEQGQPIYRCVGTMAEEDGSFPAGHMLEERWLGAFAKGADEADLERWVTTGGNYLWHIFSFELIPCLEEEAATQALREVPDENFYFFNEWSMEPRSISKTEALTLLDLGKIDGDSYMVDRDFTWTYVYTHEVGYYGPYFCRSKT